MHAYIYIQYIKLSDTCETQAKWIQLIYIYILTYMYMYAYFCKIVCAMLHVIYDFGSLKYIVANTQHDIGRNVCKKQKLKKKS